VASGLPNVLTRLLFPAAVAMGVVLVAPLSGMAQAPVGTITSVVGRVGIERNGNVIKPAIGTAVDEGDRIVTANDGRVAIVFSDQSELEIGELSVTRIDEHHTLVGGGTRTRIGLLSGIVRSIVKTGTSPADFAVHTPNAVSAVRGTKFDTIYRDGIARGGYGSCRQFTDVAVYEGVVAVSNVSSPSTQVEVPAGYETTVACSAAALPPGPTGVTGSSVVGGFRGASPSLSSAPPSSATAVLPLSPPPSPPPPPLPPPGCK